jgi:N-acetylmuramoyl-L-alanine amidase
MRLISWPPDHPISAKCTGFSPYTRTAKSVWALVPEGCSTGHSPATRHFLEAALLSATMIVGLAASTAVAQTPPAPPAQPSRFLVVLDAAHGGDDAGGRLNDGHLEKAFTLAFSVRLRSLLAARGIQVVTTREQDENMALDRRAEIADHANAQACLSLHGTESGSGIHLYISSLQPAQPARFAPWKTAQAASVSRSLVLAGVLNSALLHGGMSVTLGRATLPAVDSMTCPAVAVEIAPEGTPGTLKRSTARLDDPDYQARVAGALAAALLQWRTEAGRSEAGRSGARQP